MFRVQNRVKPRELYFANPQRIIINITRMQNYVEARSVPTATQRQQLLDRMILNIVLSSFGCRAVLRQAVYQQPLKGRISLIVWRLTECIEVSDGGQCWRGEFINSYVKAASPRSSYDANPNSFKFRRQHHVKPGSVLRATSREFFFVIPTWGDAAAVCIF